MPKSDCTKEACRDTRAQQNKIIEKENTENTEKTCEDQTCATVHEKKINDLTQGLTALENILKNMTGLCRKPNCPADVDDESTKAKPKQRMPTLPLPNRYIIDEIEFKQKNEAKDGDKKDYKTFRDILKLEELKDIKICKGATCYGAIMGYTSFPPKSDGASTNICSDKTCLPGGTSSRQCGATICPFRRDRPRTPSVDANADKSTPKAISNLPASNLNFNLDTKPCKLDTCPLTTNKFGVSNLPTSTFGTTGMSNLTSSFGTTGTGNLFGNTNFNLDTKSCNLDNCPFKSNKSTLDSCTYKTCPMSKDNTPSQPVSTVAGRSPCGQSNCPYTFDFTASTAVGQGSSPCGQPSCPYTTSNVNQGLSYGQSSSPYSTTLDVNQGSSPCGQSTCPYKTPSYEPVGLCGQPNCPMISKTSPGALKPCPYANQGKRYPCGSPSCPYVNPSGMLRTHEYTNDLSFVQEASRPYCGSASPYDYMSSLTPSYPAPYSKNFTLFQYTEPPQQSPCPYLPKKKKKSCGNPNCPYAAKTRPEKDNFCVNKTCPFGIGICGGPNKYSCDSPEVIPCESPDCPIYQARMKKKKGDKGPCDEDTCPYSEGVCGGPKKYSCDSPEVIPCETPECPVHKQDVNTCPKTCPYSEGICGGPRIFSCDNPEVIPCGSPECPVHGKKKKKKKKDKCKCCGKSKKSSCICGSDEAEGICGGPAKYSCDNPEVFPCGSPECPVTPPDDDVCSCCGAKKKKKKRKKCPYGNGVSTDFYTGGGDDTCGPKTCPYLKKLVFCDDCGGVLPDELNSSTTSSDSSNTTTSEAEGEKPPKGSISRAMSTKGKEPVASFKNALVPVKKNGNGEEPDEAKPCSLYTYPGVQIGHKDCRYVRKLIPRNMGWLWNCVPSFGRPEFWRGYKPGAILKSVYKLMKKHRKDFDPNLLKKKRSRSKTRIEDRHCIEVKQKEGDFHITVNPIKDPKNRNPKESPYMDVTPLQFTVQKQPEEPYGFCPCDVIEDDDVPSGKSSEFEFHFSPPAAIPDPIPKKKKKIKAEMSVQYDIKDLPLALRKKASKGSSKKGGKKGKGKGKKKKK